MNVYRAAALAACLGLLGPTALAQVSIGVATPHTSALLDLTSTTRGLLAPRMTAAQRTALSSPAAGLLVYQTNGSAPGLWHYNGTEWLPLSQATDLLLPFSRSVGSDTNHLFAVTQTDAASQRAALYGASTGTFAVVGSAGTSGIGLTGISAGTTYPGAPIGTGVAGLASSGNGLYGRSLSGYSLAVEKSGADTGPTARILNSNTANNGVLLMLDNDGNGNALEVSASGTGHGLLSTAVGHGAWGLTSNLSSAGVIGDNSGGGEAVVGRTTSNIAGAVVGRNDGTGYGVRGFVTSGGEGVRGESVSGYGVRARSSTGSALFAGKTGSETGSAAEFVNANTSNSSAVVDITSNSGGHALHADNTGSVSTAWFQKSAGSGQAALRAESSVAGSYGLEANNFSSGTALYAASSSGVAGDFRGNSSITVPTLRLVEQANDYARLNFQNTNAPFWTAAAAPAAAGSPGSAFFNIYYSNLAGGGGGNAMTISGNGNVTIAGSIAKGSGTFKIDHPLDPANKYLYHSFVESPDMMNVYNGNVTLDARGEALVQLPAYFEALNQDFRYQLTPLGAPGPNLYVAEEILGNQFRVVGGKPGARVSWQVTGVRHDKYAEQNRVQVEEAKAPEDRGYYLHPAAFGQPASRAVRLVRGSDATQPAAALAPAPTPDAVRPAARPAAPAAPAEAAGQLSSAQPVRPVTPAAGRPREAPTRVLVPAPASATSAPRP